MYKVDVYNKYEDRKTAKLEQLSVKRDWMTPATYNCYPITVANTIGYGVSFEDDISFIWDGDVSHPAKGILGKEYIWEGRGEGTVSITTNLVFKTNPDVSLLTIPVPNNFIKEADVVSSLMSTSFWTGDITIVLKIRKEYIGKEIVIPAGNNIACILPISISQFNNSNLIIKNKLFPFKPIQDTKKYVDALHKFTDETGGRLRLYKKGLDEDGNKVGSHEVDSLTMNVTYED